MKQMGNIYNGLFRNNNPVSSYWFGFIVGDGCLYCRHGGNKRYQLKVSLKSDDHYHLECLARRLGYSTERVRRYGHSGESSFESADKNLCEDLLHKGLMTNKTYHLTGDIVPRHNVSHFVRGLFDADGSVGFYKYPDRITPKASWSLFGRLPLLEEIRKMLSLKVGGKGGSLVADPNNPMFCSLQYGGRWQVAKIIRLLYQDAEDFLYRKKSVCDYILSYNRNHPRHEKIRQYQRYVDGRAVMKVICERCGATVWKRIDHINRGGPYHYGRFCSRKCSMLNYNGIAEEVRSEMPVRKGRDSKGTYYVWGQHGKKYRGKGARSRAAKQGKAAYAHGYKGK